MTAKVSIQVPSPAEMIGLGYTHIEVEVSQDQGRSWTPATYGTPASPAGFYLPRLGLYRVGGRSLRLVVDAHPELDIDFSTVVEYWTPQQVANRINEALPGLASVTEDGLLLEGTTPGRAGRIRVTYCDALEFELRAGQEVRGLDADLPLDINTRAYGYTDVAGRLEYRYRWALKGATLPETDKQWSEPVFGSAAPLVTQDKLSYGEATFVTADGRGRKTRVIVGVVNNSALIAGMGAGSDIPLVFETDDSGFVSLPLLKGLRVMVAIEGTTLVREFVVPSTDTFNLLQVMGDAPDAFTIQTSPALLTKRSI